MNDLRDRFDDAVDRAQEAVSDKIAEVKPRLRGWLHAGSIPLQTAAFAVLIALSPTTATRVGSSIYAASALLLFSVSGIYHRGTWQPRIRAFWRRFDHANIYVFIAGSYTPFTMLYLHGGARWALFAIVWSMAALGLVFKLTWIDAPRWLATAPYLVQGWIGILFLPAWIDGAHQFPDWVNVSALVLVVLGGVLYTLGGVVYAAQRPDPAPEWFGFHEVFHLFTVLALVCQYVAVSLATYSLR